MATESIKGFSVQEKTVKGNTVYFLQNGDAKAEIIVFDKNGNRNSSNDGVKFKGDTSAFSSEVISNVLSGKYSTTHNTYKKDDEDQDNGYATNPTLQIAGEKLVGMSLNTKTTYKLGTLMDNFKQIKENTAPDEEPDAKEVATKPAPAGQTAPAPAPAPASAPTQILAPAGNLAPLLGAITALGNCGASMWGAEGYCPINNDAANKFAMAAVFGPDGVFAQLAKNLGLVGTPNPGSAPVATTIPTPGAGQIPAAPATLEPATTPTLIIGNPNKITQEKAAKEAEEAKTAKAEEAKKKEETEKAEKAKTKERAEAEKIVKARMEAEAKAKAEEVNKIIEDLYKEINTAGTDTEKIKAITTRIDKDNVLEVLKAWEESQYATNGISSKSLINTIMYRTCEFEAIVPIKDALVQRSNSDESKQRSNIIDNHHNSLFHLNDSHALKNTQELYESVKKDDAAKITEKAKEDAKKFEEAVKAEIERIRAEAKKAAEEKEAAEKAAAKKAPKTDAPKALEKAEAPKVEAPKAPTDAPENGSEPKAGEEEAESAEEIARRKAIEAA